MKDLVKALIQKQGFVFGKPWMNLKGSGIVVPILRTEPIPDRAYVTLQEVPGQVMPIERGTVEQVRIANKSGEPVFIRKGTILAGGGPQDEQQTQTRAVSFDTIIMPEQTVTVDAKCIHQSHYLSSGAVFKLLQPEKSIVTDTKIMASLSMGQDQVWRAVDEYTRYVNQELRKSGLTAHFSRDQYVEAAEALEKIEKEINEILQTIPTHVRQVGMIILDNLGVSGIEVFDHPDSFNAIRMAILRIYHQAFSISEYVKEVKFDEASIEKDCIRFLSQLMEMPTRNVPRKVNIFIIGDISSPIKGEYATVNNKTIHLAASYDVAITDKLLAHARRGRVVSQS